METEAQHNTTQMAADLVAAYVSNNSLPASELGALLVQVHGTLVGMTNQAAAAPVDQFEKATPAQIRKSISPDALISFLDGKPYKTLKRHLTTHGLDFATYRERYGLPASARPRRRAGLGLHDLRRHLCGVLAGHGIADGRTSRRRAALCPRARRGRGRAHRARVLLSRTCP